MTISLVPAFNALNVALKRENYNYKQQGPYTTLRTWLRRYEESIQLHKYKEAVQALTMMAAVLSKMFETIASPQVKVALVTFIKTFGQAKQALYSTSSLPVDLQGKLSEIRLGDALAAALQNSPSQDQENVGQSKKVVVRSASTPALSALQVNSVLRPKQLLPKSASMTLNSDKQGDENQVGVEKRASLAV